MATDKNIRVEHGVLTFRNFTGEKKVWEGRVTNEEGKRNFCFYLDGYDRKGNEFTDVNKIPKYKYGHDWLSPNELVEALQRDKWPIKWTKESPDGTYPARPYMKVNVKYNSVRPQFNPKAFSVRSDGDFTTIDEDSISQFDTVWIDNADFIIKPYNYEGEGGRVSAELKIIYVTPVRDIDEDDDFDGKYVRPGFSGTEEYEAPF